MAPSPSPSINLESSIGNKNWEDLGPVTVRDHYGFAVPPETIPLYLEIQQSYAESLAASRALWQKYILENGEVGMDKLNQRKLQRVMIFFYF